MFFKETRFKETTVGRLPVDWKDYTLDEVSKEFISGGTPSTKEPEFWNGDIPWIRSIHLTGKYIDQSSVEQFITEKGLKQSAAKIVPRNSLIVATRVGVGKSAFALIDVAINQDLTGIVLDRSKVNLDFVVWYLHTPRVMKLLESFSRGTTIKGITQLSLKRLPIPCPPLIEQQKIAKVLSVIDKAIQKTDEVIAKTERLKKGLMQELLTKGIGHKEFKETKIGKIPETWKVVKLGEVATIERGKFAHRPRNETRFYGGRIPFIQTGDIAKANGIIRNYFQTLNEEGLKISRMFKKGTIVISIAGNIGDVGILGFDACFPDSVVGITSHNNVNSLFLMWMLQNFKYELSGRAPRSTQKNINLQILKSLRIPLPELAEQEKIADILSTINEKLNVERSEKSRLERIRQSLMDLLLTGKVRVRVD